MSSDTRSGGRGRKARSCDFTWTLKAPGSGTMRSRYIEPKPDPHSVRRHADGLTRGAVGLLTTSCGSCLGMKRPRQLSE
jgi:hypothetical protein